MWEILDEMKEDNPRRSYYNALNQIRAYQRGADGKYKRVRICPVPFCDPDIDQYIVDDALSEAYHVPVHGTCLMDYPHKEFEALTIIRSTRNEYDELKAQLQSISTKTG